MAVQLVRLWLLSFSFCLLLAACSSQNDTPTSHAPIEESASQSNAVVYPTAVEDTETFFVNATTTPLATATSEPVSYELLRLRQYLRDTQSSLLELYQKIPQMTPEQRSKLAPLMRELAVETSHVMAVVGQLIDRTSTDNREAAKGSMQRLQADIEIIQQSISDSADATGAEIAKTPGPLQASSLNVADIVAQMDLLQQRMPSRIDQIDTPQLQTMIGSMADVIGDLDEMAGCTTSTFNTFAMEQRESFADSGQALYEVAVRIELDTSVEMTSTPWASPMFP